jgi:chromosome segregation ATPase
MRKSPPFADELAAAEAGLSEARQDHARASLAAVSAPDDAEAADRAQAALAALRAAEDRVANLSAAAELAREQADQAAEEAAQAERQRQKDRLVAERDRVAAQWSKEQDKINADQAVLDEAGAERDWHQKQLQHVNVKISVYTDRIANAEARADELVEHHAGLEQQIADFPVTADELADRAEAAHRSADTEAAERLAEMQAASDAEIVERYDGEMVEVEPMRVATEGDRAGWRFAGGCVIAVPRRDLDRLAEEAARCEEDAMMVTAPPRSADPWRKFQMPPWCLGRLAAIATWARTADPADIAFCLGKAREREDAEAVEILAGHTPTRRMIRTARARELEEV